MVLYEELISLRLCLDTTARCDDIIWQVFRKCIYCLVS